MTYAVTWAMAAIGQFNQMLAAANDPDRIRRAADWVDYTLRRIPLDVGESRSSPGERIWFGDVLRVYYRVDADAMTVRVISVAPARRR